MQSPLAAPQDVADIWRPLSLAEEGTVMERIMAASRMVVTETPLVGGLDVNERITAGLLDPDVVRDVVVEIVERVVVPPRFARQHSVTVDDGTESTTVDASVSSGEMFISDRQMARLLGRRVRRQRAFTITPAPGPAWTSFRR